jgi:hypothetical protein
MREWALNACAKLTQRSGMSNDAQTAVVKLLGLYQHSPHVELQQRSFEYSCLVSDTHAQLAGELLSRMPVPGKRSCK